MSFLFIILLMQTAVCICVAFVLKAVLNKTLVDAAVGYLERYRTDDLQKSVERICITSHKVLDAGTAARMRRAVEKNISSSAVLEFRVERRILGGVVVGIDEKIMDFSLRDRLKRAF